MAPTLYRTSLFVALLLIVLTTLYGSTQGGGVGSGKQHPSAAGGSLRRLLGLQRKSRIQMVGCSEMASKAQCSEYATRCQWCRSDAIDDMCFSRAEAWRLPPQIFSCD